MSDEQDVDVETLFAMLTRREFLAETSSYLYM
jgi:hypothetical protein